QLLDELTHDVEAEPGAAVRAPIGAVDLSEHVEDVRQVVGRDADAGVTDEDRDAAPLRLLAAGDHLAHRRELERVADEVLDDDLEFPAVAHDRLDARELPLNRDAVLPRQGRVLAPELVPELADVDRLELRRVLARGELVQVERRLDHLEKLEARLPDGR